MSSLPRGLIRPPFSCSHRSHRLIISITILFLSALLLPSITFAQEVPELQITSKHYIVIDADTGEVFAQRGANDEVAMASLTKIFTTIEALERANLDDVITTKSSDLMPADATVMGFGPGEQFTLRDLLYGMMLPSGNDAAFAIARSIGYRDGDTDEEAVNRFVAEMNTRVRNMGLVNTNLVRPDGWGVKNHHSTAHDLAVFTMYALNYPTFVDLISTSSYTTADGNYTVTNTNKMLNMDYPGLIGGKTGYDDDAGYCLIEVARRNGNTMISVTLDGVAPDDWYDDNRVLLNYAFDQKESRDDEELITGEVLTYRDPDAAQILQQATPGGSVGLEPSTTPATDAEQLPTFATPTQAPPSAAATDDSSDSGGMNGKLILAIVVTALVVGAGILGSVVSGSGRGSRPRPQPRPRPRRQPRD